ncbi:MAG: hypothetical protein COZ16_11590 [Flavobacteriaceae bacterium CG_4_10_14_3_um_filter_31_253]|nr:MAG: hypothetical protein AUK46_05665 [Flavobacteriaceae bacterium CG2_30_31_66]PIV96103.1 MAG: hypothetical protein COW43_10310 [Flavobacteriaceae bacterium CG17_big_fil_post_rev_8_21_14_2_50_31_13]PIX12236.1 MAG: hypothetical protein COZ74_11950 [Flavobacteriaceae bacterium CG_4_8_14_3_um_filter_31_8]PIY14013.1 MAG: hypothetical protein COZ16_11590 [Flavobacteriaceae bacterium CG_4_10_14_3_um_filter_31_253]PIZ11055.1 MAG: hypothetical protein COY55_06270 [Flavobacteriaceae bacterium CG_4_1
MKKRHEQKMILLSVGLLFVFNLPFIFIFNSKNLIFGIPIFYFSIAVICLISVIISLVILKKFYE